MWVKRHIDMGTRVFVPGIVRYELQRELLRPGKDKALASLDAFIRIAPNQIDF